MDDVIQGVSLLGRQTCISCKRHRDDMESNTNAGSKMP